MCLQVKKETHTQYRYFNRQNNKNKGKRNKTERYNQKLCIADNVLSVA